MVRVLSHWQLRTDPFEPVVGPFVPLPGASEAVARAAHAVESGERRLRLVAPAGLGKTTVLRTALAEVRRPSRRIATASAASGPEAVLLDLASGLGHRPIGPADGPSAAWKAVRTAVRLARIQGLSVVLAIDDVDGSEPEGRALLDRLAHVDPHPSSRLTILEIGRGPARGAHDPGELAVRLGPLTRGEAEVYVRARLARSGRDDPAFTPRALSRLHALAEGVPAAINRLGSLSLMAGAARGLEIVGPEVVDGIAGECLPPD